MNNDPTRKDRPNPSSVGQTASNIAHNIGDQAHNLGDRAASASNRMGERASDIAQQVSSTLDTARQKFNDTRDVVVDKTKVAAKATDDYVVNNPWKAVGIASGIALVLGLMMRRR